MIQRPKTKLEDLLEFGREKDKLSRIFVTQHYTESMVDQAILELRNRFEGRVFSEDEYLFNTIEDLESFLIENELSASPNLKGKPLAQTAKTVSQKNPPLYGCFTFITEDDKIGYIPFFRKSGHLTNDDVTKISSLSKTSKNLDDITANTTNNDIKSTIEGICHYLTDKQRLKAIAVLGGTIAGVAILKDKLPEITDYLRETFPQLSREIVSLSVDTITNTLMAPCGFLLSSYANSKKLNGKEVAGQVAFAAAWGIIRHYVYSGLSHFDEVTPLNVSLKTSLYTLYYVAYGGLYAAFSEYWSKVCNGSPHLQAIKDVGNNFKKKLRDLVKDSGIQFNLALNIANMFNPFVESRPTVAGGLLIDYNMGVVKHSHEREFGFWGYLKSIFVGDSYKNGNPTQL